MRNRDVPNLSDEDAAFVRSFLLFEDAQVLAFNKPSGLPSQGGGQITRSLDSLLVAFAKSNGKRPRLVHRLDTQTSGIMIVAKTKPAAAALSREFAERRVKKVYLAIVSGDVGTTGARTIDASLVKVREGGRPRMLIAKTGRQGAQSAITNMRVLARGESASLVQLSPQTGRMHQLRIHMAYIGHPILGDPLYGKGRMEATRLMLHASRLSLLDPTGAPLDLSAELSAEFLEALRLHGLQDGL